MVAGDISILAPAIPWLFCGPHPSPNQVRFEDIGGLEDAKRAINEAVILPLLMPEFFVGLRHLATSWFSSVFLGFPNSDISWANSIIEYPCISMWFHRLSMLKYAFAVTTSLWVWQFSICLIWSDSVWCSWAGLLSACRKIPKSICSQGLVTDPRLQSGPWVISLSGLGKFPRGKPWKGVLLYAPPGAGPLGRAVPWFLIVVNSPWWNHVTSMWGWALEGYPLVN